MTLQPVEIFLYTVVDISYISNAKTQTVMQHNENINSRMCPNQVETL